LFGDYKPTGKLPRTWPRTNEQATAATGKAPGEPLFPYGFGLSYSRDSKGHTVGVVQ
jgi:beta-glucosidase